MVFAALGWTGSVCLRAGGKETQRPSGILGNTKQTHIKFPSEMVRGEMWRYVQQEETEEETTGLSTFILTLLFIIYIYAIR